MHSLNIQKAKKLMDYQVNCKIDISLLSETWFYDDENYQTSFFRQFGNYEVYNNPRVTDTWGGGVCVLASKTLVTKRNRLHNYVSFEVVCCTLTVCKPRNCKLKVLCLYRKDKISFTLFCEEFSTLLNDLFLFSSPILIAGDFNVPWNLTDNYKTKKFKTIVTEYGLHTEHIPRNATHKLGNTLDLIICDEQCQSFVHNVYVDNLESPELSDHFPVVFSLKLTPTDRPLVSSVNKRRLNRINCEDFVEDVFNNIHSAATGSNNHGSHEPSMSNMVSVFNDSLSQAIDKHAPTYECNIKHTERPTWLDNEYVLARAERRRLERVSKRTNLPSDILNYEIQRDYCIELVDSKRSNFFSNRIIQAKGNQKVLFNTFTEVCDYKSKNRTYPESSNDVECANNFNQFFTDKVKSIHKSIVDSSDHIVKISENQDFMQYIHISSISEVENSSMLSSFKLATTAEISELLSEYGIKHSPSDPVPSKVLLNCFKNAEFVSHVTDIVNVSLKTGSMDGLKNAVVSPLLKKDLDENENKSFRPVSQLPFLSKLIERVVLRRLNKHMAVNDLNKDFQHGYKKQHSTETLLLKFVNDLIVGIDQKMGVVVLLVDLSAAFDTVNHNILLNILAKELNITGVALTWFRSFLSQRTQQVKIHDELSDSILLESGVVQGSVLGPVLYNVYSRSTKKTFAERGFECLAFADDKNGYTLFSLACEFDVFRTKVPQCLEQVKTWASEHLLKLNKDKTEILVFGDKAFLNTMKIHGIFTDRDERSCIRFSESAKYLGVWLDTHLTFDVHVSKMISSGYAKLRKIRTYRKHITKQETETLIHAFISSKIGNCNSILMGINRKHLRKVQKLQNAAIRTVYRLPIRSSVSDCYKELHWLNVEQRITFKLILFVFKAMNGKSPDGISELIKLKDPVRMIVRENTFFPRTALGRRAFCYLGPRYWNVLPINIRQCTSIDKFKTLLKSHILLNYQSLKDSFNARR